MLEIAGLTKKFGGLTAVNNIDVDVRDGEILGLIGPNGSGKTTIFNLVTGFLRPNSGKIIFDGKNIAGMNPREICKLGVGRTFQVAKPFQSMTVIQNILVGAIYGRSASKSVTESPLEVANRVSEFVGLADKNGMPAKILTLADMKRLELARALATGPRLVLLDETMAGLNPVEVESLMRQAERIRDQGVTLLVIEHVMKAIMTISDRIVAIDHGSKIAEGRPREVARNKEVIEAYLGEED
jgi:branched-chain amino acid transport system ATP-binding protein